MKGEDQIIPALGAHWATRFYDPLVRLTTREYPFKRALLDQADLNSYQSVLDLGCGTGTLSIGIKRRAPSLSVIGIDADSKVLDKGGSKSAQREQEIDFIQGFSYELPFEKHAFDAVFSTLLFHHLSRRRKIETLAEIARILKPGGYLHIADYGKPSGRNQQALSNIIKAIDGNETTNDNFAGRLGGFINNAGFENVEETARFRTLLGTVRLLKAHR